MSEPPMPGPPMPAPPRVRPLLLLDVDGVLLVVRTAVADDEETMDVEPTLHPEAGAWLRELAEAFELVWATTWADLANRVIAPALGLPPLPAIGFDMARHLPTPKLSSVIGWVGDRPCAWIDDDLHHDADTWAAGRSVPTLLVHVDMARGLDRRHVDQLLAWAREIRRRMD